MSNHNQLLCSLKESIVNMKNTHFTTSNSYIHLGPHIPQRNDYHDYRRKMKHRPYQKFQTGSTTTFSGYTNINRRNYDHPQQLSSKNYYYNNYNRPFQQINNYSRPFQETNDFQQPSRRMCRSKFHADQYKNYISNIVYQEEPIIKNAEHNPKLNLPTTLILSDSMCKFIRPEQLSSDKFKVELSYESGCTCSRMADFLQEQTSKGQNIFKAKLVIYSLGTNDVANIGADATIKECHRLTDLTRTLFPNLQQISWIALSPRTKPSRRFNADHIQQQYLRFNKLLKDLSKRLNFDVIYANLQIQHLHTDGLHPSISSGRVLIENAIKNYLNKKYVTSNQSSTSTTTMKKPTNRTIQRSTSRHIESANNNMHQEQANNHNNLIKSKQQNYRRNYQTNSCRNIIQETSNDYNMHSVSNSMINYYPHFLRHKQEFFRKITLPDDLIEKKDEIFALSNLHFKSEYFRTECEKWKVYTLAAERKQTKRLDITIDHDESLPVARPSPSGLAGAIPPLDFTDYDEIFNEWLPESTPARKRKMRDRTDSPPSPSPIRQPPAVRPRRMLPSRDPDQPLVGGSLQPSPSSHTNSTENHRSFNCLMPTDIRAMNLEARANSPVRERESSMVISPIRVAVSEPITVTTTAAAAGTTTTRSPSVIPKQVPLITRTFKCSVIPIECRYHFKRTKQRCTFETIKQYQGILQRKYQEYENETEMKLQELFGRQEQARIVDIVKQIINKPIEEKNTNDRKRLDNLILDQMKHEALGNIEEKATEQEAEFLNNVYEKFTRTLQLKLQLDKLEKRFVENMPPPSLNIFDKLELRAKELTPDNNELKAIQEQWKNVLRKTKLELTSLMRQAKVAEIEQSKKQYEELKVKVPIPLIESYSVITHVAQIRHDQYTRKKLHFLERRACIMREN